MSKLAGDVANKWQRYNKNQKMLLLYSIILLLMLLLLPIIKLNYLNSTNTDTFTIFNSSMTKVWVLSLLIIGFLLAWNASYKFKKLMHQIFGFAGNDTLVNTTLIFMMLVLFFSIGDTIGLLKQNFSFRISTTNWYLVIGFYLILGLLGSLAASRIHHKKSLKSAEISITSDEHTEKQHTDFHQNTHQDNGGLFEEEQEEQEPSTHGFTNESSQIDRQGNSGQLF